MVLYAIKVTNKRRFKATNRLEYLIVLLLMCQKEMFNVCIFKNIRGEKKLMIRIEFYS